MDAYWFFFGLKVTLEWTPNKEFLLFEMEELTLGRPSVLAGDSVIVSKPGRLTGMEIAHHTLLIFLLRDLFDSDRKFHK